MPAVFRVKGIFHFRCQIRTMCQIMVDDADQHTCVKLAFQLVVLCKDVFLDHTGLIVLFDLFDAVNDLLLAERLEQIVADSILHGSFGIFKFIIAG